VGGAASAKTILKGQSHEMDQALFDLMQSPGSGYKPGLVFKFFRGYPDLITKN